MQLLTAVKEVRLSLTGKYSEDFITNVVKYIVFLESTHVCISIIYTYHNH